ncbi:hypothetical protein O3P69_015043 [Scylla paramamosain]|uniref:Uncharacterized protein n=1 Tax=Scylla paramamosain TaxID=85552 RepID=A0AAW0T438_SCYPA
MRRRRHFQPGQSNRVPSPLSNPPIVFICYCSDSWLTRDSCTGHCLCGAPRGARQPRSAQRGEGRGRGILKVTPTTHPSQPAPLPQHLVTWRGARKNIRSSLYQHWRLPIVFAASNDASIAASPYPTPPPQCYTTHVAPHHPPAASRALPSASLFTNLTVSISNSRGLRCSQQWRICDGESRARGLGANKD